MSWQYLFAIAILLAIWLPWLWRYKIKPHYAKDELISQLKQRPDWPILQSKLLFLIELYKGVNARAASRKDRKFLNLHEDAFIYGEIAFLSFFNILNKVNPQPSDIFYDLGCGSGKALYTAALYFPLAKVCGIELLPRLDKKAVSRKEKITPLLQKESYQKTGITFLTPLSSIHIINDNFLNQDFSDGTIIFINATCLSYQTWQHLLDKFQQLKTGTRVIVTSKKIENPQFQLISQTFELMSWGVNSVNIYRKL